MISADYLVTGDEPLLQKVGPVYQGVSFIKAADFLKVLQQST